MSKNKAGYEAIPDVEKGESAPKHPLSPLELYPEASLEEAELLRTLDACIDGSRPALTFSKVYHDDVATSSPTFCCALLLPMLVTVGLCCWATYIATGSTDGIVEPGEWFPYVAAIIIWFAAAVSISSRLVGQASFAINAVAIASTTVDEIIDSSVKSVLDSIDDVQYKLHGVVGGMSAKLVKISKIEKSLKKYSPSIEIPDPTDMEKELDGATNEIDARAERVKEACSGQEGVPGYLNSATTYWWRVVFPILLGCLALQIAWTFAVAVYLAGMLPSPIIAADQQRETASDIDKVAEEADTFMEENVEVSEEWILQTWSFVIVVLSSFVFSLFEIGSIYAFTSNESTASMANNATTLVSESTDRVAREVGLYATIESVRGDKMPRVKAKLLKAIRSMNTIAEVSAKLPTTALSSSVKSSTMPKSVPKKKEPSLLEKLLFGKK